MKILIVDDDHTKSAEVIELLKDLKVNLADIETVNTAFLAKEKLYRKQYDLLILDINLPYDENEDCSEEAGYMIYKEIQSVKSIKKPKNIVILTSYEELKNRYIGEVDKSMFTIVKYHSSEIEWKNKIRNKVKYMVSSSEDSIDTSELGYNYDLAIITAVQIEFENMKRFLDNPKTFQVKSDPTIYTEGYLLNGEKKVRTVLAMQHQMGMTAASVLTTKLINNFKPKYISMVGIAAGKRGEGNYGDIIIPTEVWDYGSGKISVETDNEENETKDYLFKPDPKYISLEVEIKEIINADFTVVLNKIKQDWIANKPETSLKVLKGPMACGSVVVQNEQVIKNFIDPYNRKLKGLDMESYGVFYSVENSYRPKPKVIVCKSICDFADRNKNDNYQAYAAYTSAAFLNYLVLNELA